MNNVDLEKIELERKQILERYKLDEKSISDFKSKIKKVTEEESLKYSTELHDLIFSKTYTEDDDSNFDSLIKCVQNGANVNLKEQKKGDFPLLICARKNYIKTFIILIKAGANVNQANDYLTTATMAAARHGNKEILELLILMGADINARCKDGDNAIISAKIHDQVECFNMLVNANAILNNSNVLNQSIIDVNSKSSNPKITTIPKIFSNFRYEPSNIATEDDVTNLIDEAISKMKKINM